MGKAAALQRATVAEADLQDVLNEDFTFELEQSLKLLNARIRALFREFEAEGGRLVSTAANLGRAIQLRADLRDAIRESGFAEVAERAIDAPLDRLAAEVLKHSRIAAKAADLTPFNIDALAAFKELRLAELLDIGEDVATELWRLTLDGVTGSRPLGVILTDVEDALDAVASEARTVYDTAVSSYSRQVEQLQASGDPDELFLYAGPADIKNREFCKDRVGKVFSRDEIDEMDNGQLPNVMLTGGGYNCRHAWKRVSILDEELRELAGTGKRLPEVDARLSEQGAS
jgi:hypothetical protein